jgi:hypothetical protein
VFRCVPRQEAISEKSGSGLNPGACAPAWPLVAPGPGRRLLQHGTSASSGRRLAPRSAVQEQPWLIGFSPHLIAAATKP